MTELAVKDKCPVCHMKHLELDAEGDIHCWGCGRTFKKGTQIVDAQGEKKHDKRLDRHQFYENNKADILKDYQAIGGKKTAEKWKVGWVALYQVLRRWGIKKPNSKAPTSGRSPQRSIDRHSYYEDHKDEIISDLFTFGRLATRKKWGIKAPSSLATLEKRWLTPDQKAKIDSLNSARNVDAGLPQLPSFPPFSNSWEPQVQVMWLQAYMKLLDSKVG